MEVRIIPSVAAHAFALKGKLRSCDAAELQAAGVAGKAVWRSFRHSAFCKTAFVDDEIAAMWGLADPLAPSGKPWLLTTPAVERVPVTFVKVARSELAGMLEVSPRLVGVVDAAYDRAIRFLEVLGFSVGSPFPCGPWGMPFREYRISRPWVSSSPY